MSNCIQPSLSHCARDSVQRMRATAVWLTRICERPWYSYLLIVLLQLHVVWGMWDNRDVTTGDTANYFNNARTWWETGVVSKIHFSPLYIYFYGIVYGITQDIAVASWLHRIIIIMAVSLLLLTILRRLLSPLLSLCVAAWWVVLPINYNTLYEVHLFAVIPVLCAWLFTTLPRARLGRACALATLLLTTLLMRNEMIVAALLFAGCVAVWEWRPSGRTALLQWRVWLAYAAPAALVLAALAATWAHVPEEFNFEHSSRRKHTMNMGQVYAFGWQQRHPEWNLSPWLDYQGLMQDRFGAPEVSLREMLQANPQATFEHFLWNLRLTPNGLQVLLFNAMSGSQNPDYVPVESRLWWPQYLFSALLVVIGLGGVRCVRNRQAIWEEVFRRHAVTWQIIVCTVIVCIPVILTQRPRPSYLFTLSMFLMICSGIAVHVLLGRWLLGTLPRATCWLALTALVAGVGSHFDEPLKGPYVLKETLRKLRPFEDLIKQPETVFVKGAFAHEIQLYLGRGRSQVHYYNVLGAEPTNVDLPRELNRAGANLFYLDEPMISEIRRRTVEAPFVDYAPPGWKLLASSDAVDNRWKLYQLMKETLAQENGHVMREPASTENLGSTRRLGSGDTANYPANGGCRGGG